MAIMSVYGVELPIAIDSLRVSPVSVGMAPTRNANGYLVTDRRDVKNEYNFAVVPRSLEEAMLYKELLLCAGDYWASSSDNHSSKGMPLTGTGSMVSGFTITTGQTMIVPVPAKNQDSVAPTTTARPGHTLVGWRSGGTTSIFAWSWRGIESWVSNKRERLLSGSFGPCQTYTGTESFSFDYATRLFTVTETGASASFIRMLWIPRFFGVAQLDAILMGWGSGYPYDTNSYPDPPRIIVQTDLLPRDLMFQAGSYPTNIVAIAEVAEMQVTPHWHDGAYDKTALALSVTLIEV